MKGNLWRTGLIRFVPDGEMVEGQIAGKPVFAKIENGKYALTADKGATVGKNRVEITSYRGTGRMLKMSGEGDETEQVAEEEQEQFIPARHNTDSTLLVEVKEGREHSRFRTRMIPVLFLVPAHRTFLPLNGHDIPKPLRSAGRSARWLPVFVGRIQALLQWLPVRLFSPCTRARCSARSADETASWNRSAWACRAARNPVQRR